MRNVVTFAPTSTCEACIAAVNLTRALNVYRTAETAQETTFIDGEAVKVAMLTFEKTRHAHNCGGVW